MIKTSCLVLLRLAQSCVFYVKLDSSRCRFIRAIRPGSIDRSLGSINQNLGRMYFSTEFQLSPSSFKTFKVLCFCPRYIRQTLATFFSCSYCYLCKSLVRPVKSFPLHKLRIIKKRFVQELDDHSVAAIKALRNTSGYACTCWRIRERRSPWSRNLHVIVLVSFYWWVVIGC